RHHRGVNRSQGEVTVSPHERGNAEPVTLRHRLDLKNCSSQDRRGTTPPPPARDGSPRLAHGYSASGTCAVIRGLPPATRVMCPRPVRSSASITWPGPNRYTEPSPTSISTSPAMLMTYWRRGAV